MTLEDWRYLAIIAWVGFAAITALNIWMNRSWSRVCRKIVDDWAYLCRYQRASFLALNRKQADEYEKLIERLEKQIEDDGEGWKLGA